MKKTILFGILIQLAIRKNYFIVSYFLSDLQGEGWSDDFRMFSSGLYKISQAFVVDVTSDMNGLSFFHRYS